MRAFTRGLKVGKIYSSIQEAGADCSLIALKKFIRTNKLLWEAPQLTVAHVNKPQPISYFRGTNWWEDLVKDGKQLFTGTTYNFSYVQMPDDASISQRTVFEAAKYMQESGADGMLLDMAKKITENLKLTILPIQSLPGLQGFMLHYGKLTNCRVEQQQFKLLPR
jgi:hypothetical protein